MRFLTKKNQKYLIFTSKGLMAHHFHATFGDVEVVVARGEHVVIAVALVGVGDDGAGWHGVEFAAHTSGAFPTEVPVSYTHLALNGEMDAQVDADQNLSAIKAQVPQAQDVYKRQGDAVVNPQCGYALDWQYRQRQRHR